MTVEPIRKKEDIEAIKSYFLQKGCVRDYALFAMGINSGISVNDLVSLRWGDVYDAEKDDFLASFNFKNGRTGREMRIALNESCKSALSQLLKARPEAALPEGFVFSSKKGGHITRFRAFQIIKQATEDCGIKGNFSCHSMKKTHSYHVEKAREVIVPEL